MRLRVWDPLVRILHWSLAVSVPVAMLTDEASLALHQGAGYLALACTSLRALWGFVGPPTARFRSFVRGPRATAAYFVDVLARQERRYLGHNPLGGWMVCALLATIAATATTGWMFTLDRFWGLAWLEALHRGLGWLVVVLTALHVGGVLFTSLRHRENLMAAMVTGFKSSEPDCADAGPCAGASRRPE